MKARVSNNTIVEILVPITGHDINDCFHPDILAMCIDTPEGANIGWHLQEDGTWAAPVVEEPVVEEPVVEEPTPEETPPAE